MLAPNAGVGERGRQGVLAEPSDLGALERVGLQGSTDRSEVEHERVKGNLSEAEAKSVEDHDEAHRLNVDARLLEHFLDGDLGSRVADVGPTGRVEPGSRVRPSHEQDLAFVVADDGTDRDLRRHVTGNALAHVLHPFDGRGPPPRPRPPADRHGRAPTRPRPGCRRRPSGSPRSAPARRGSG